ncbi:murein biosynthesis integral membrane protein MurJ [Vallitaleaceae bacterium 9-2]
MKKTAFIIIIITILSKIIGFARDIILSYFYGAQAITDAYLISKTIPSVMFMLIGTAIVTGFIPIYTDIEKNNGVRKADQFTSRLINFIFMFCLMIFIIVAIFTPQIVKLFASGFSGEILRMTVNFTRINMITIFVMALIYIFKGYLQIKGNFVIPSFIGLPLNIVVIISIIISSLARDVIILPIGYVLAVFSQLFLLLLSVRKVGYKHSIKVNIFDNNLKKFLIIVAPTIIGVSVNEINVLVDRTLASRISIGGISALNYANQLNLFVQGVFVLSLATVMYPNISKLVSEKNLPKMKKSFGEIIIGVAIMVMPATVGSILFSEQIISLIYGRGAFDSNAISLTATSLMFYSIGMIGFGLREIVSRVFYALQDTKTPMMNAAIGMVLNIVLNLILSQFLGIGGLALATSIAAIFTTVLLFISLRKKVGPFGMKQISMSFLKILFASLIMGGLAKLSFNYLTASLSQNLSLLIAIGVGAVSYFVIIYFMKIEDVDVIVGAIKKKLGRGDV